MCSILYTNTTYDEFNPVTGSNVAATSSDHGTSSVDVHGVPSMPASTGSTRPDDAQAFSKDTHPDGWHVSGEGGRGLERWQASRDAIVYHAS